MSEKQNLVLPTEADARNQYPLWDGLFAYFPVALAEIARLSKIANEQHNPGEPMHWARGKSRDHKNKIIKHMLDTGPVDAPVFDTDGTLHSVKMAWRAVAFAQEQLEHLGRPHGENAAPESFMQAFEKEVKQAIATSQAFMPIRCPATNEPCKRHCPTQDHCDGFRPA